MSDVTTDLGTSIVEAAQVDTRSRRRRLIAPLATLAGSAAGLTYLGLVDPNEPGHYPLCPLRALFGIDCPGCGMLRGTHDLVTGDVAGALDNNVLLVLLIPLAIVIWFRWFINSWRGIRPAVTRDQLRRRTALLITGLLIAIAFGVVRNFLPYVGSGIG